MFLSSERAIRVDFKSLGSHLPWVKLSNEFVCDNITKMTVHGA